MAVVTTLEAAGGRAVRTADRDRVQKLLFIVPACLYLAALSILPFVYSVYLSFFQAKLTKLNRKFLVGFDNYAQLFNDGLFLKAIQNTAVLSVASIVIEVSLGFLFAKVFLELRDKRAGMVMRSVAVLPMMITPICVGLIFSYILNPTLGIANYLLGKAGIMPMSWFGDPSVALLSVIFINSWQWTPFMMLLILAGLVSIPESHYEAAEIEGAKWYHVAWWIELPAIRNVILIGVILRIIDNLRLFDIVYVTTRGGPGDATELVTFFAYRQDFRFFQVGYGSAAAVIILLMSIVITTVAVGYMRRARYE